MATAEILAIDVANGLRAKYSDSYTLSLNICAILYTANYNIETSVEEFLPPRQGLQYSLARNRK